MKIICRKLCILLVHLHRTVAVLKNDSLKVNAVNVETMVIKCMGRRVVPTEGMNGVVSLSEAGQDAHPRLHPSRSSISILFEFLFPAMKRSGETKYMRRSSKSESRVSRTPIFTTAGFSYVTPCSHIPEVTVTETKSHTFYFQFSVFLRQQKIKTKYSVFRNLRM